MSEQMLTGRCFCGAVAFEVRGPALFRCICHCESCRKASGGAFVPWATFNKAGFTITSGNLRLHRSSPGALRGHCAKCGTSLTYEHEDRAGQVDITPTSFDDDAFFEPVAHIWVEDKLPWIRLADDLPQYRTTVSADEN